MSNTKEMFIDKYKESVQLIITVLSFCNVTQSERVKRIYENTFDLGLLSDQSFFESINWYAKKVIGIASRMSMRASKRYDYVSIRFWNSVIIVITPLLGDKPWFDVVDLMCNCEDMFCKLNNKE